MIGLGVMIKGLGGNASTVAAHERSKGKTIEQIVFDGEDALRLQFMDGTTLVVRDEGQSCCERRYMTCDDEPLDHYNGATYDHFETVEAPSIMEPGPFAEPHDVQFLNCHTSKGTFQVSTHVEHNGYYGGFAMTLAIEEK